MTRIEVYEKFLDVSDEELEAVDRMGMEPPQNWNYRRTYVPLYDIWRPAEIPGNKEELRLIFNTGDEMTIKGNYDTFCIQLNDKENSEMGKGDGEE